MTTALNTYGLSPQQYLAMIGQGNFLLTACPGSGKTRSVAARAAWLKSTGRNLALLSHTKVGAREIATAAYTHHNVLIGPDSFVGTLHSFLARYVLAPFGHLVTGSSMAVAMDEDAVRANEPPGLDSTTYGFTENGDVEPKRTKGDRSSTTLAAVKHYKMTSAAQGYVSFDDALYWSFRVLSDRPDLAKALVRRFDEVLIDEAQDSSSMQLACLRELHSAGLKSLVLVGDFDQSIYSFSGASPALCQALAKSAGLTEKRLSENYRSSQLICNVSARFRSVATPDVAVGPDRDYPIPPQLVLYDPSNVPGVRDTFEKILTGSPGDFGTTAILTRANALANVISGQRKQGLPETLALLLRAKHAQAELTLDDMRELQIAVLRRAFGSPPPNLPLDSRAIRAALGAMVTNLPEPHGDMVAWSNTSYAAFDQVVKQVAPMAALATPLVVPASLGGRTVDEFLVQPGAGPRIENVYGVKGESVDAVMVVAEAPAEVWHTPQADTWASALAGARTSEEIRIFYVAATRARRLLILAVPNDTSQPTIDDFERAGFHLTA